jgi:hypothetical protein
MCDYSLMHVKSRPAAVGDKLVVSDFNSGTKGFAPQADSVGGFNSPDRVAVCLLPGTEIAFEKEEEKSDPSIMASITNAVFGSAIPGDVAIFRQIDKDQPCTHHDALEFPGGKVVKLTTLKLGTKATVLQLPAVPKTESEAKEQERLEVVA